MTVPDEHEPPATLRLQTIDGAVSELLVRAAPQPAALLYWLPALGVAARHYDGFATALATRSISAVVHEWRGGGSSDQRASRRNDWAYRELLADVAAGIAAVRARFPGTPIAIGGHSLGGQLAALGFAHDAALGGLVLVASGIPYWRTFRWWQQPLLLAVFALFRAAIALAGHYPGKTLGFAGREAGGVMRDWIRTGLTGRYRLSGVGDLDASLAARASPVIAVRLADDRYAPEKSFTALLAKMPRATSTRHLLQRKDFQSGLATHFSWLKDPDPVVEAIASAWAPGFAAGRTSSAG